MSSRLRYRGLAAACLLLSQTASALPLSFTPHSYALGNGQQPVRLLGGVDLNSDGRSDLITVSSVGTLTVFARQMDGSFVGGSLSQTVAFPYSIGFGDFNADGRTDIVHSSAAGLQLLLQSTTTPGSFNAGLSISTGSASVPRLIESIVVADFNGDTRPDIAAIDNDEATRPTQPNDVFVAYLKPDGSFDTTRPRIPTSMWPRRLVAVNSNGDNRADLLVSSATSFFSGAHYDNVSGNFVYDELGPPSGFDAITDMSPGDINGDNKVDVGLLVETRNFPYLRVDQGSGNYSYTPHPTTYPLPFAGTGVRLGDFDNDSKLDALVSLYSNGDVSAAIYRGNGDLTFQTPPQLISSGFSASGLARSDYNNDGRLDFALLDPEHNALVVFLQN